MGIRNIKKNLWLSRGLMILVRRPCAKGSLLSDLEFPFFKKKESCTSRNLLGLFILRYGECKPAIQSSIGKFAASAVFEYYFISYQSKTISRSYHALAMRFYRAGYCSWHSPNSIYIIYVIIIEVAINFMLYENPIY